MTINVTVRRKSVAHRTARLLTFGLVGWLWFLSAADSEWRVLSLVVVLAMAALVGITWNLTRVHAEKRSWTALDDYGKQEQVQRD